MITQYGYLGEWKTIDEITNYLKERTNDEKVINDVIKDVLNYAKVRHLVEK